MNKLLMILIGLVLLLVPIYAWIVNFWGVSAAALLFLKGAIVWGLLFIGFVLLVLGLFSLKD